MQVEFKDFVPEMLDAGGFFKAPAMEEMAAALQKANAWIAANQVDIVNIETVVLPNIHDPNEKGSQDTYLRTSDDFSSYWHQFIRVWHRKA